MRNVIRSSSKFGIPLSVKLIFAAPMMIQSDHVL